MEAFIFIAVIVAIAYFIWRKNSNKPEQIERRIQDLGREFRKDVTTQWDKFRK